MCHAALTYNGNANCGPLLFFFTLFTFFVAGFFVASRDVRETEGAVLPEPEKEGAGGSTVG